MQGGEHHFIQKECCGRKLEELTSRDRVVGIHLCGVGQRQVDF